MPLLKFQRSYVKFYLHSPHTFHVTAVISVVVLQCRVLVNTFRTATVLQQWPLKRVASFLDPQAALIFTWQLIKTAARCQWHTCFWSFCCSLLKKVCLIRRHGLRFVCPRLWVAELVEWMSRNWRTGHFVPFHDGRTYEILRWRATITSAFSFVTGNRHLEMAKFFKAGFFWRESNIDIAISSFSTVLQYLTVRCSYINYEQS